MEIKPPEPPIDTKERLGRGAFFIPAGLFIGFGLGYAAENLVTGTFIGLGIGFAIYGITLFFRR
jgi:hypothetical protein